MFLAWSVFPLFLICTLSYDNSDDTLLNVIVFTRHGDRQPLHYPPYEQNAWFDGYSKEGQLSNQGMLQHQRLGVEFRERYVDKLGFLSERFNRSEFLLRSTAVDRTLMSAYSLLAGLYPPSSVNATENPLPSEIVPVVALSTTRDPLLQGYNDCDAYSEFYDAAIAGDEFQAALEGNRSRFEQYNACYGWDPAPMIDDIMQLYDPSTCDRKHFGQDTSAECDAALWDEYYAELVGHYQYWNQATIPNDNAYVKKTVAPLFVDWAQNLRDAIAGDPQALLHLYSAHDTNVLIIQAALALWDEPLIPPFASHFVAELWQSDEFGFYVNFTMNAHIDAVLAASFADGSGPGSQALQDWETPFRALHAEIPACVAAAEALGMPGAAAGTVDAPNTAMPGCPYNTFMEVLANVSADAGQIPFELAEELGSTGLSSETVAYFFASCAVDPSDADRFSWVVPTFGSLLAVCIVAVLVVLIVAACQEKLHFCGRGELTNPLLGEEGRSFRTPSYTDPSDMPA